MLKMICDGCRKPIAKKSKYVEFRIERRPSTEDWFADMKIKMWRNVSLHLHSDCVSAVDATMGKIAGALKQ
jgi:hypothetical protein